MSAGQVGLNTLVIPRKSVAPPAGDGEPWVYLNCGHVQGRHQWGQEQGTDSRTCPMCLKVGPHPAAELDRCSGARRGKGFWDSQRNCAWTPLV